MEADGATRDSVLRGRLRLWQPAQGARVTMDPLLLAHFAHAGRARLGRVLDLGSGTGVLAMTLALADPRASCVGVEIVPELARLARKSVAAAELADRVQIVEGDFTSRQALGEPFDLVVANPPYTPEGRGKAPVGLTRLAARLEVHATLEQVVEAGARRLGPKGRLCVIVPVGRLPELFAACEVSRLVPRHLRAVHSHPAEPARRLLVEAGRGHVGDFQVLPTLVVHDIDRKSFSPQARAILDGEWLP